MPAIRLRLTSRALEDLAAIGDYVRNASGEDARDRIVARLLDRCEQLIRAPGMGTPHVRRRGIRKVNLAPYKIFYRVTVTEITVLRIWDGRRRRDPPLRPAA